MPNDNQRCKRCVELHQGPPPGWEKDYPYSGDEYDVEDEYDEDEYEYEYAVRQLIRPEDDGVSDSILISLHIE